MPRRMCWTTAITRIVTTAGFLLPSHSQRAATAPDPDGGKSRSAQTRQLLHYNCDGKRVSMRRIVCSSKMANSSFAVIIFILASLAFTFPSFAPALIWAQTNANANAQSGTRKTSQPYTGDLSIFEKADRDKKLQVQRVMDILGIQEGARVADIGAGSGWFTVRA